MTSRTRVAEMTSDTEVLVAVLAFRTLGAHVALDVGSLPSEVASEDGRENMGGMAVVVELTGT